MEESAHQYSAQNEIFFWVLFNCLFSGNYFRLGRVHWRKYWGTAWAGGFIYRP